MPSEVNQSTSVDDVAKDTLMGLSEQGETPRSVGGVDLVMGENDKWSVQMGADYDLYLPFGKGPVSYDTTRFASVEVAFQAALAAIETQAEDLPRRLADPQS